MLVDKTINATVKTSAGIASGTKSLVKSGKDMALNTVVNFSPDFYDEHQDFATGGSQFIAGKSIMTGQTLVRTANSLRGGFNRGRNFFKKTHIKKKRRELQVNAKRIEELNREYADLKKMINNTYNSVGSVNIDGITSTYLQTQIRSAKNKAVDLNTKKRKLEYKQKKLDKKYQKLNLKSLHPIKSTKNMMENQTRKVAAMIFSKDDFGSKTIGSSLKTAWTTRRFSREVKNISKSIFSGIKSLVTGIITIVTSIPALVVTIVASLPIVIIIVVIAIVISCFASTTYTGRIGILYMKIDELNSIYKVELNPAEILAISDVLDWTTQDAECFEQLVSLMLDQQKENKLEFEEMAKNVFIKYNPANIYETDGVYSDDMPTGYTYWSLEGFNLNFIINNSVKKNLSYNQHLELYPIYRDANSETRIKMADEEYQNEMIKEAIAAVEVNQQRWEDYIYEYNLGDIDLTVTGDNQTGIRIVKKALTKLGCDYIWGAGHGSEYRDADLDQFDCSSLICWSFYQAGVDIGSKTTKELVNMGVEVPIDEIQAGDIIVYYNNATASGHVVLYIGNEKVVHAPQPGDVVKVSSYTSFVNRSDAHIRRLY